MWGRSELARKLAVNQSPYSGCRFESYLPHQKFIGTVAQLVERLVEDQCVTGSIPVSPASLENRLIVSLANFIGESSNGKMPDFDSGHEGSIPSSPAKFGRMAESGLMHLS